MSKRTKGISWWTVLTEGITKQERSLQEAQGAPGKRWTQDRRRIERRATGSMNQSKKKKEKERRGERPEESRTMRDR